MTLESEFRVGSAKPEGCSRLRLPTGSGGLVALTVLSWSTPLLAQDGFAQDGPATEETGVELGLRLGLGEGAGPVGPNESIRDRLALSLPLGADLGFRLSPRWLIGAYVEYAFGYFPGSKAQSCENCSRSWTRLGLQVEYRLFRNDRSDVWLGVGTGRQWINIDLNDEPLEALDQQFTEQLSGPEYLRFVWGAQWRNGYGIGIGPFSSVSFGGIAERRELCDGDECPSNYPKILPKTKGVHLWFTTGLRLVFLP